MATCSSAIRLNIQRAPAASNTEAGRPVLRLLFYAVAAPVALGGRGGTVYFLRAFLGARIFLPGVAMLKCSSFLPDFSAAASHRGFNPRPAHVSAGFAGLRYFGTTGPRTPRRIPLTRNPLVVRRSSLPSWF